MNGNLCFIFYIEDQYSRYFGIVYEKARLFFNKNRIVLMAKVLRSIVKVSNIAME